MFVGRAKALPICKQLNVLQKKYATLIDKLQLSLLPAFSGALLKRQLNRGTKHRTLPADFMLFRLHQGCPKSGPRPVSKTFFTI